MLAAMRLVTYIPRGAGAAEPRLGAMTDAGIVDVEAGDGARAGDMLQALASIGGVAGLRPVAGGAARPLAEVRLLAPLPRPPSFRDFMAFEKHVRNARARRGLEIPDAWYETPVFYYSNAAAIRGPEDPVWAPPGSAELDFEFEVAAVIGKGGIDIPREQAFEHVAGLTILNDWSARDLQMKEMPVLLGPAKGKDFATTIGPWLLTFDELHDRILGEHIDLAMTARLNGQERTSGNLDDLHHAIPSLIAHASAGVELFPGDVLGTGTLGGGCLLEDPDPRYLQPGDMVELEVERLGVLRTEVVARPGL
jgi:2-keto-4-pentenoate hydratase/2-oxohepta-3-ene-1,7-dioic acid hydratase in catechol pathway